MKKIGLLKLLAMIVAFFAMTPVANAATFTIPDFPIDQGGTYTASVSIDPGTDAPFS